uniref:Uncharacterized protein n=1 Tax=Scophthalmus maximus TaxID=52904 RepID=A0A8D3AWN1_SCOMX
MLRGKKQTMRGKKTRVVSAGRKDKQRSDSSAGRKAETICCWLPAVPLRSPSLSSCSPFPQFHVIGDNRMRERRKNGGGVVR